ncbi:MAG: glycosyltransferase family 4 protein [Alphaproteobacteria bacterium]|nr:glycosyltransferase family 4 protein [Alphaproteobacteria bacterium]
MRIAFYAPLKPTDDPVPSGDRRMGRMLLAALRLAGHDVEFASRLRSRDGAGDRARQERLRAEGAAIATALVRSYRTRPPALRPQLWFTYHLYYKAPDWIGPQVAQALGIPYVVAEASVAAKRAGGPWDLGHRASLAALAQARLVIGVNPADAAGVRAHLAADAILLDQPPFLDAAPFAAAAAKRDALRAELAAPAGAPPGIPWLLVVAMMRTGDKLASYQVLGAALPGLLDRPWRLLVAGDGPARAQVEAALAACAPRVAWLGRREESEVAALCAACDLMLWPAVNEAYGMALLEAQAAGLPVVAGRSGGVPAIVRNGQTGRLVPVGDAAAFAAATRALLADDAARRAASAQALEVTAAEHDLAGASRRIDAALRRLVRD